MIKQIRTSKFTRFIAFYLAIMLFLEMTQPMQMYALTSGPTQPEFNSFIPIETSDMVNLSSGDFNYNIPVMDVGGYPINLSYNSGVTMDQEASWVGLGWNLNVGQIQRQIRGLPDDFNGDIMNYENDLRDNNTVGANFYFQPALFGENSPVNVGMGLGVQYNNYEGITFKPSYGITYEITDNISVGANFSSSVGEGASVRPSVSLGAKMADKNNMGTTNLNASFGVGLNSRKGLENMSLSASASHTTNKLKVYRDNKGNLDFTRKDQTAGMGSATGSISFNDQGYTPTKRTGFSNTSFSFDGAFGVEIFGVEGQAQITGYGSFQSINPSSKNKNVKAFGYENTQYKNDQEGVLDFNREKEVMISETTNVLPVTNYTYDTYSIDGQGVGGMFRPFRSQVSHVYNDNVYDYGSGGSAGVEFGGANLIHGGIHINVTSSLTKTGQWKNGNNVLPLFSDSNYDANTLDYEPYAYKLIGELNVDSDAVYHDKLLDNKALRVELRGTDFNWRTAPLFKTHENSISNIQGKIKRSKRMQRNQVVYKVTKKQAENDPFIRQNNFAEPHHTAGIKVLQPGGTTYVYGETVYNTKKVEATFDVSSRRGSFSPTDETVYYNGDVRGNGTGDSDHYVNKITTPKYAHSYLLTGVLSPDYEDVDHNGPTDNDLGAYTKFDYVKATSLENFKWRVPYGANRVSYNEGLRTDVNDDKGNYIYGEKELKYLQKIETKTHVAYFDLEYRQDALGVNNDAGGRNTNMKMKYLKSIRLYAKSELKAAGIPIAIGPGTNSTVKPIKTAHFEYSYALCPQTPSSVASTQGKLTLTKVYFTYKNSNMGRFTPYEFTYSAFNPDYSMKENDIWGNYKETAGPLTNSEFPFVEQDKTKADENTSAWTLKSISLPSGGKITLETESDDYQYVQDKKAMQMFKVIGAGENSTPKTTTDLYSVNKHFKYIYVKLSDQNLNIASTADFVKKYINEGDEVYFRFLLNMTSSSKDFVNGYFKIDNANPIAVNTVTTQTGNGPSPGTYAAIPLHFVHMGGGAEASKRVNPITKAGWSFGRKYLNRHVYSLGGDGTNKSFSAIVKDLVGSIEMISELWKGPNKKLQEKGCAKSFDGSRSWIRLKNPDGRKFGGGLRVKSVELSDNWDVMTSNNDNPIYKQKYGQEYSYTLDDATGTSSGVATFEPNSCAENPFVMPFYAKEGGYESALSTRDYVEEPFGENFFPAATVTYSRVTVSNLDRTGENGANSTITKHGTGKVVTEHFTSKDFPTIVKYTDLDLKFNEKKSSLFSLLDVWSINHIYASQGFSIETNDMNGKIRKQTIYGEGQENPNSWVEYKYNVDANDKLDNNLTTIDAKGEVKKNLLGVTTDLITDFNESDTQSDTMGVDVNIASFLVGIFPVVVPIPLPKSASHENIMRTATTTKVIHKTGILVEKIAYDLGSTVSTKNLAWDAGSGDVLLTETINEYNDKYYSFTYPAYWMYKGMGLASNNIGIEGTLVAMTAPTDPNHSNAAAATPYFKINGYPDLTKIFQLGDQLSAPYLSMVAGSTLEPGDFLDAEDPVVSGTPLWVVGFSPLKNGVLLMDKNGKYINTCLDYDKFDFKIVRSGYRNLQSASMASITLMKNPIVIDDAINQTGYLGHDILEYSGTNFNPRIVNASAVVYKDFWRPQLEMQVPYYPEYPNTGVPSTEPIDENGNPNYPYAVRVNPYVWNIKGEWRAEKSYAYLTGRNASTGLNNPRNEGFYTKFSPFYHYSGGQWQIDYTGWTSASTITKFSPFGPEIENEDALHRFSSAQYGYKFTLPMAVASNSQYQQIGFEGFEESLSNGVAKHFMFNLAQANLSNAQSHTGKKSLKVGSGSNIKLTANLKSVQRVYEKELCPTATTSGDGGGTACSVGRQSLPGGTTFVFDNPISIIGVCSTNSQGNSSAIVVGNNVNVYMGNVTEGFEVKVQSAGQIVYLYMSIINVGDYDNDGEDDMQLHGGSCSLTSTYCF